MGRTAEYEASVPKMLQEEKDQLESELKKLRKQRKDEGRFLDIEKEERNLASIKEQIAAAISAGKVVAEKIVADAEVRAAKFVEDANKAASDAMSSVAIEWGKVNLMKVDLEASFEEIEKQAEKDTARGVELDTREKAIAEREKHLKVVMAAHRENLDHMEF